MDDELRAKMERLLEATAAVQEYTIDLLSTTSEPPLSEAAQWEEVLSSSAEIAAQIAVLRSILERVATRPPVLN